MNRAEPNFFLSGCHCIQIKAALGTQSKLTQEALGVLLGRLAGDTSSAVQPEDSQKKHVRSAHFQSPLYLPRASLRRNTQTENSGGDQINTLKDVTKILDCEERQGRFYLPGLLREDAAVNGRIGRGASSIWSGKQRSECWRF